MSSQSTFVFNPQQQYLFKRSYALAIGKPGTSASLQYANFAIPGVNGQLQPPSPLRIQFDIDKNGCGSSNKSKISVYNFSLQSRQTIKKGWVLRLQAGYNGLVETIFFGNIPAGPGVKSKRDGPDIITEMECGDGENAIAYAVLDKSYPAGTTLAQIITDLGSAMGATVNGQPGVGAGVIAGIPAIVFNNGRHVRGSVRDSLDEILKPYNLKWNVHNGNLNILPRTATNGQSAILVNQNTGMIGVPSFNNDLLQFTNLLNPRLIPDALIQMESENTALNGFYKLNRCHYEGDTHDTKWQVACEGIKVPNLVQALPTAQGFNAQKAVVSG